MAPSASEIEFDAQAVNAKYAFERDKRLTQNRGAIHDVKTDPRFRRYVEDPFTPWTDRAAVDKDINVAMVGAGMSGVVVGAKLREAGLRDVVLVDQAGGIGGTWYWNRYPGVMCDVESYIYMPMLEEMNYVPTTRYAFGDEIRRHLDAIAVKYGLIDEALFHTGVDRSEWDEATSRWVVHTDRGDDLRAKYLILAVGILNLMKVPAIPGMEEFQGPAFHTARWDYEATGGSPDEPDLDRIADSVVGVIGVGASGIQAVPPLAAAARHVYVFQRTPSAIGERNNRPTPAGFAEQLEPGWQRDRMENFSGYMIGHEKELDLTDDGWTLYTARLNNPVSSPDMTPEALAAQVEQFDFAIMEEHRSRIDNIVSDTAVAASLKPYYRYGCKRPCFHDEYLPAFNRDNVTLVDCPAGVTRITPHSAVANGREYELDCIVYATGFEGELTPFARRAGHPIVGRDGVSIEEHWKGGVLSMHGLVTNGFPNMFVMPAPGQQSVISHNYTHVMVIGADHVAQAIVALEDTGAEVFDPTDEAVQAWTAKIVSGARDRSEFMATCTPSRLNFEGHPEMSNPRNGTYGGGFGDLFGYQELLAQWRHAGGFEGWSVSYGRTQE
jgi:cation diffusion facilitator CzcD-associated flavoprotein CzcO